MKKILLVILAVCCIATSYAQTLRIGTYNLRNENTYDTGNLWMQRYPHVADIVRYHDFDIFGVQEALSHQLATLKSALPGYAYYGIGRDDGKDAGEHEAIFYKTSKFEILKSGDFWLSATPDVPSKSWDAPCCNRICSWVEVKAKSSGKTFFMFNAHYDYEKDFARNESSKLMLKKIESIAGDAPVVFTGDLNGGNNDSWYKLIANSGKLHDTYVLAKSPYYPRGSFNNFGKENDGELIDHIFVSKDFTVKSWAVLSDTYGNGKYPSDHCPVFSVIDFN